MSAFQISYLFEMVLGTCVPLSPCRGQRAISWSCFLSFTFTWVSRITLSLHMCAAASALPTGHLSAESDL